MLHFARWKIVLIVLVVLGGFVATLPNFFSKETVASWPNWMPKRQLVLGLDLQGGAYLLYEVDRTEYVESRLRTLLSDVRKAMLEQQRIGYTGLAIQNNGVQLRIRDLDRLDEARTRLEKLTNPLSTSLLGGSSVNEFDLSVSPDGIAVFTYSEQGLAQRIRGIVSQSIEVIGRRIDELGTTEPSIQRQGEDRILVEAPGLGDPARLKAIVGQTAQLTFHLVEGRLSGAETEAPKPGTVVVPSEDERGISYILADVPLMTGEDLVDAQATPDSQRPGQWAVNFRLTTGGGQKFGEVTQANVGRQFAIVLDNKVISAPVIQQAILGGSGVISGGNFTAQSANDLAILLRAGSLPAKLTIVEERTIGPSLGADSIRAGVIASIVATLAIIIFMIVCYGILGVFANIALIANNFLMIGILSALGATLTLPGIAGIVLTMGMAVDANVLIYERMREESKAGRSTIAALDAGFSKAYATIIDSHLTALIAAIALFWVGSGPIRGFAITLSIGIVSTLFTAYLVTRLIVSIWVRVARPKEVPL